MKPCVHSHCPSSKLCCQRYTCTRELRNRLERRRSERDQLKVTLAFESTISMKALRRLREDCSTIERDSLSRAKREYEDHPSKVVKSPKCFCAECAVEHKDREIASLRKTYRGLQMMQQVVADVQRQKKYKSRPMGTNP